MIEEPERYKPVDKDIDGTVIYKDQKTGEKCFIGKKGEMVSV